VAKDNIIDMWHRRQKQMKQDRLSENKDHLDGSVHDMTVRRQEIIQQERREVKRTLLTEFIGASVVIPERGLLKVSLFDVSENGISFDVLKDNGIFIKGEEIAIRVYLNQYSYFPFYIKVKNKRYIDEEDIYRIGGELVKDSINELALYHFVKFIENISASLKGDKGDIIVSHIK
jgi:hypothetical protein